MAVSIDFTGGSFSLKGCVFLLTIRSEGHEI